MKLRLAQESLEETGRIQQVGMDDLQRDAAARGDTWLRARDLGQIDRPHAPGAELGDDPVRAEESSFRKRHGWTRERGVSLLSPLVPGRETF